MLAVYAASQSADDPLSGLEVGERPDPEPRAGLDHGHPQAAGLNHHDVWSLRGVGLPADRLPMILGCDGAGVDADGNEVIVHAVVPSDGWRGDETLDPRRTLLSELHDGTLAEKVLVPTRQRRAQARRPVVGARRLPLDGVAHGIPHALHQLRRSRRAPPCWSRAPAVASPPRWSSSARPRATGCGSPPATRPRAPARVEIGADRAFGSGERLPDRVDAVMETVGAATWSHSVNSLKPGGTIVICGATSGDAPAKAELTKIFFKQLRVVGSTMGTRVELERLAQFVVQQGIEPVIDSVLPLEQARDGFAKMAAGDVFGKVVFTVA